MPTWMCHRVCSRDSFSASTTRKVSPFRHSMSCAALISAAHNTRRLYSMLEHVHPQLDGLP